MLNKTTINFKGTGVLNNLVEDYLERKPQVKEFYAYFPDIAGFAEALKHDRYTALDRTRLSGILADQAKLVDNTSEATLKNISLLNSHNAYTVTTGHQLCLFTGPLYFVYKIISTIKLAKSLKKEFPKKEFIPAYWMASEDHDFVEINHFTSNRKKITWQSTQSGAVGEFKTKELHALLPLIKDTLGISENASALIELFEKAYLNHDDLSLATRYLVNHLFGKHGLVIVDGNDARFKDQFREFCKKDIFENLPYKYVTETNKQLQRLKYPIQVNPREINSFFMEPSLRTRIEKKGNAFLVSGGERLISESDLRKVIDTTPEKISPNVVTRPLYQQVILPNLAYIGGPGELTYWLQLKKMFDEMNVFFPVLVPRNFAVVVSKSIETKIEKLGLNFEDIFKPAIGISKKLMELRNLSFDITQEIASAKTLFEKLNERVLKVDQSLKGKVAAVEHRTLKGLEQIAAKTDKANKKKLETELNQVNRIKEDLFPNDSPQERRENFSTFYLSYGETFFDELYRHFNALELKYAVLTER